MLANIALREGERADVGLVVMDEFHFYGEPGRGWAWQVPLIELPQAQHLLMSATLGDVTELAADLTPAQRARDRGRRRRRTPGAADLHLVADAAGGDARGAGDDRPGARLRRPLHPGRGGRSTRREPAQRDGLTTPLARGDSDAIAERLEDVRFAAGFGKTLSKLLRRGIGVHHAGMLPRYRRLVEQLAQAGLLTVICGTDTLGVGINVPIRTVLFSGLAKYDGQRQRVLKSREFLQIAGRAGRAGFDTVGYVVVQAPEHVIDNEKAKAKAAAKNAAMSEEKRAKRGSKAQLKKPPPGTVVWTEQTFDKLVEGRPEPLKSQMKVDNAMLVNVLSREEDAFPVLRRLTMDNHEDRRSQLRLARRAVRLTKSLLASEVLTRLDEVDELRPPLRADRGAAGRTSPSTSRCPTSRSRCSTCWTRRPRRSPSTSCRWSRRCWRRRGRCCTPSSTPRGARRSRALKAEGVEYDERMALIEDVTWPQPLADLLEPLYETYRERHPWLSPDALAPKSVVREMWEQGMGFTDLVGRYQVARSEGLVLRYLTDAYRALRQTVPASHRTEELDLLVEWLGETVRQVDSSLLDEWEALSDPEHAAARCSTTRRRRHRVRSASRAGCST